ncbi:hypothetical protein MFM001_21320 [Mycobacterium sp. MFM001]|uniref:DUF732 domain-containing protein n=1 Tax=Mycobacterium sp. MFM001 TaxID=2049453 RepID=UPI000DA5B614|nr:DUF732 domain-containing protein [Mycobacterium sp. MFM001]GBE65670.1 hypothetical protein MFM001_21320 [Mycobacterium sp. MFM001]
MRKQLAAVLGGVLAVTAIGTAPFAAADENSYINALNRDGIGFTNRGYAIAMGNEICRGLGSGLSPDDVANTIVRAGNAPYSAAQANRIIADATTHLCPG